MRGNVIEDDNQRPSDTYLREKWYLRAIRSMIEPLESFFTTEKSRILYVTKRKYDYTKSYITNNKGKITVLLRVIIACGASVY